QRDNLYNSARPIIEPGGAGTHNVTLFNVLRDLRREIARLRTDSTKALQAFEGLELAVCKGTGLSDVRLRWAEVISNRSLRKSIEDAGKRIRELLHPSPDR